MKKKISIIFSFKNEYENLSNLIERTLKSIDEIDLNFEFIFFNDASTDNSQKIIDDHLKILEKRSYTYKVFNEKDNIGVFPSLKKSLLNCSGDAAIYLDCDLQDPPEIIPKMIKMWLEGIMIVNTVRKKRFGETFLKIFLTKVAYKLINFVSEKKILENSGDFKLIDRCIINKVIEIRDEDPFLRHFVNSFGYSSSYVEYDRDKRASGMSKFQLNSSISPYVEFQKGLFLTNKKLSVLFLILSALIFFSSIVILLLYFAFGFNYFFIYFLILINLSLLLFSISCMTFFLNRIYKLLNKD